MSQNSSRQMIKEENDKKGGCFNWLLQTFETTEAAVACSATKFPRTFSYE